MQALESPASPAPPVGVRPGSAFAPPLVAIENLAVRRDERTVLDGVSFEVRRGEIFGLLGPNGSGKTTFFRVLTGTLLPDAGRILVHGRATRAGDRALRRRMGVVFQDPALDPRLSARENLILAARLYGVPGRDIRPRVGALLQDAGIEDRADEAVSRLSGGTKRRVEVARALIHEPSILVLDEPTTGLDEASFRATWSRLLALRRERGLTLLLTTHRPEEAEHCDRLAILDGGRIVASDTPDRLRERVRGDLLVLDAGDPVGTAEVLRHRLGLEPRVLEGKVVLERERAHEWIPRIVEALPAGALRSVSLRRTGLGEVFLGLTGHDLAGDGAGGARSAR